MVWQPIETAPRDGTDILIWDGDRMLVAWWQEVTSEPEGPGWCTGLTYAFDCNILHKPTHWMPLPAAPSN